MEYLQVNDGWVDKPDKTGIWVRYDTLSKEMLPVGYDTVYVAPEGYAMKYKFIAPFPVAPKLSALDAEIASAAIEYFGLLERPAIQNNRTKEVYERLEKLSKSRL
jgi:hypothetical protein